MKVVHITTVDEGGAYKATCRIHQSLQKLNIESEIILRTKNNPENIGHCCFDNQMGMTLSKIKNGINLLRKRGAIFRDTFGTNISKNSKIKEADIIVLHWINSFLTVGDIQKLASLEKPIFWVLHDMWPLTGGCHCALECEKYKDSCGNCSLTLQGKENDNSRKNWCEKANLFKKFHPIFVGPSQWITNIAKESSLLENKQIYYIPHGIDTDIFKPLSNVEFLKRKYRIPLNKRIICFGAAFDGMNNPLKGFQYLLQSLEYVKNQDIVLLIFGNANQNDLKKLKQQYIEVGYIQNEAEMAEIYNISDVYVTPSLQETFGFTVCESLSSGTPVVGFSVGGILEQIDHCQNGYLVPPKDVRGLAEGIEYCLTNINQLKNNIRGNSRDCSLKKMGCQYAELFDLYRVSE